MIQTTRFVMERPGEPMLLEQGPAPIPEVGEVLVEVAGCGVCHTDLGFFYDGVRTRHALPLTLGHEISGFVVQTGPGAESWRGKAVIVPAVIPCGDCEDCRDGLGAICTRQIMPGNDRHGGFASHVLVPARGLCEVPGCSAPDTPLGSSGVTLRQLSVVADAVSTPYQAVKLAGVGPGSLAVVLGTGGIGGYAVQVAAALGAQVIALDVDDAKLARMSEVGATATLNVRSLAPRDVKKQLRELTKERGLATTRWRLFECSGTRAGQETAFELLNHGGVLMVVGFTMEKVELRLSNLMAFHARAQGNWGCLPELYPELLELVLAGRIQVADFVRLEPLETINTVFHEVHEGKATDRIVLVPGKESA